MASAFPNAKLNGKLKSEFSDIEAQIATLSAELAELTRAESDIGQSKMAQMTEEAKAMGEALAAQAANASGEVRTRLVQAEDAVEERVRANPMAALGVAAGVGFLAALMLKR